MKEVHGAVGVRLGRRPPAADRGVRSGTGGAARSLGSSLVVLVLGAVVVAFAGCLAAESWPAFRHLGLGLVTGTTWDPTQVRLGALPFIVFGLIWYINPGYMNGFFADQRLMIAACAGGVWMAIGVFIMAKMIAFEI